MPRDGHDWSAVGLCAYSGTPEFSDELYVFGFVQVKNATLVVLELWMVNALLGDNFSANQPDALNFEVGLFTSHAHSCESVLSE